MEREWRKSARCRGLLALPLLQSAQFQAVSHPFTHPLPLLSSGAESERARAVARASATVRLEWVCERDGRTRRAVINQPAADNANERVRADDDSTAALRVSVMNRHFVGRH